MWSESEAAVERRVSEFVFFFFALRRLTLFFSIRSLARSRATKRASVLFLFVASTTRFSPVLKSPAASRGPSPLSGASFCLAKDREAKEQKKKTASRFSSSSSSSAAAFFARSRLVSLFLHSFPFPALLVTFSALFEAENTQSTRRIGAEQAHGELKRSKRTTTRRDASSSRVRPPRLRSFSHVLPRGDASRCFLCIAT